MSNETVNLDSQGDASVAQLFRAVVGDGSIESTSYNSVSNLNSASADEAPFPTSGRVAELADGTLVMGNGSSWVDVRSAVGLEASPTYKRRLGVTTSAKTISDRGVIQGVDTSGGTVTVTLASAIVADGAVVIVTDEAGNAGTNAITVATEGSETVDGATSGSIASNYGELRLYSDGTNWFSF